MKDAAGERRKANKGREKEERGVAAIAWKEGKGGHAVHDKLHVMILQRKKRIEELTGIEMAGRPRRFPASIKRISSPALIVDINF